MRRSTYVVVQFYPSFEFYFPLVLGKVVYDNEFKTKGNKNKTKDKIEPQHIYHKQRQLSNSDNDAWRLNHVT